MSAEIESLIRGGVDNIHYLYVEDEGLCTGGGGPGGKYKVLVVSDSFKGKGLLDRHRLINELLVEPLKHIHALQLKTWTVEEYEKKKST